ncbi:hypothetical protein M0534_06725 [Methylonatrum kenyense]|uniref:hypothetical protein n=1 Tax=Methylonatrum kenyense TaxID=455253 RepID=UPI0020BEEE47|nr:hypothetical protein [Methylonatrum kenyense]MCK8516018.1 hypothetical protein [Methylonatrum kenyense]
MFLLRRLVALLLGAVVAAASGSLIQTQFNVAALARLQVDVGIRERLAMTAGDLLHFAPIFALLLVVAFLPAFCLAGWLARRRSARPGWLYALAGGTAVLAAFLIMNQLLPMTAVQMTAEPVGLLALSISGVLGGWAFALTRNPTQARE